MKKFVLVLLLFCLLLAAFSGCTASKPNPASDFEYTVNSEGSGIDINKYVGASDLVVIPAEIDGLPVTSLLGSLDESRSVPIPVGAFEGSHVKRVTIPKTVEIIGRNCFANCAELEKVSLSEHSRLTIIAESAFVDCVKLETVDLSETELESIYGMAFMGCSALKEVKFPDTLEQIHDLAFSKCTSLLELELPKNLTQVGDGAFGYCEALERVVIPAKLKLTCSREAAFHTNPSLKSIVFEDGREDIVGYAFFQKLPSVEITVPKSVKRFSSDVFLANPEVPITLIFLGDAPELENETFDWFGTPTVYYDPATSGWDSFAWKDQCTLTPKK